MALVSEYIEPRSAEASQPLLVLLACLPSLESSSPHRVETMEPSVRSESEKAGWSATAELPALPTRPGDSIATNATAAPSCHVVVRLDMCVPWIRC